MKNEDKKQLFDLYLLSLNEINLHRLDCGSINKETFAMREALNYKSVFDAGVIRQ